MSLLETWEIVAAILGCALLAAGSFTLLLIGVILTSGRTKWKRLPAQDEAEETGHAAIERKAAMAEQQGGFESYEINPLMFACVWREKSGGRILCVLRGVSGTASALCTRFDDGSSLLTMDSLHEHLYPHALDQFVQTFHKLPFDQCWNRHIEAEKYLEGFTSITRVFDNQPLDTIFMDAERQHMKHVRSIPFWYFKVPYWFLFRRRRMNGLTIEQQHRQGLIDLTRTV